MGTDSTAEAETAAKPEATMATPIRVGVALDGAVANPNGNTEARVGLGLW